MAKDQYKPDASALAGLFDRLRDLPFPAEAGAGSAAFRLDAGDQAGLAAMLAALGPMFVEMKTAGAFANPWTVGGVRRDELRNSGVLAWFLDPQGDHGCGDGLLRALLLRLRARLGDGFPPAPATGCSVQVEECAPGDRSNRMDITVDDPGFFLIIEVKIDAGEQSWQMERYCDIAVARAAGHRPWAAIYLTRDGRAPDTAGRYKDRNEIVCFSWCDLSGDLRRVAQGVTPIPAFLIRGYANHIATL